MDELSTRANLSRRLTPYMYIMPALAIYSLFVIAPIGESFRLSLFRWPSAAAAPEFAGAGNFLALMRDAVFWSALRNNVTGHRRIRRACGDWFAEIFRPGVHDGRRRPGDVARTRRDLYLPAGI